MTIAIKVGPPVLTINRGSTFMVTDQNGEIDQAKPQGLFAEDTRFLSTYQMYINERSWERVTSSPLTYYAARLELTNPDVLTPDGRGTIEARTIALTLDRQINAGLHETFHIANYSQTAVKFMLELAMRSDFADIFEVKAGRLTRRGQMQTTWSQERCELTTAYHNDAFSRQMIYHVEQSGSKPSYANGRLIFEIDLAPGGTWDTYATVMLLHQGRRPRRQQHQHATGNDGSGQGLPLTVGRELSRQQDEWRHDCTLMSTSNHNVTLAYQQSVEDMGALRLPEHDLGPRTWVPAAGVPWFVALFGRDSLTASFQTMAVHAPFATGALRELARYQAKERDDWRDAQPGKILHELRHGELAFFHQIPFTPYYGTADATILYLIVLHEAYTWIGDPTLLQELKDVADRCLEWIDHFGDLDGDGFQEWKTFSDQGYNNMAWKDAGDAIVYRDGSQTVQPKGTCELQGYVYDAKIRMADVYDALGDPQKAARLRQEASELQQRFDKAFWMEDEGCYALGLDHEKKLIDAVASNMGHCLWSGIVPAERAGSVVKRLLEPDMWCGWGVRTLSSRNPAYNPYSYQRGSVWPHDNGFIAAGMKRYGYHDQANQVAQGIFAAASYFDNFRLPEVFSGLERQPDTFPSQYIGANIPQAWAAGSVFHFIRTMLGLRADAPNHTLYVNPTLPNWLPDVQLDGLKVGDDSLSLRFRREGDRTGFEVVKQHTKSIEVKLERKVTPVPLTPAHRRATAAAGSGEQLAGGKTPGVSAAGEQRPAPPRPQHDEGGRPQDTADQLRAEGQSGHLPTGSPATRHHDEGGPRSD